MNREGRARKARLDRVIAVIADIARDRKTKSLRQIDTLLGQPYANLG